LDVAALIYGTAFTVLDLLFIVFLNDVADRRVDRIKREMFPDGCSAKTIPDGILSVRAMAGAGLLCGLAALVVLKHGAVTLDRPALVWAGPACLVVFLAYSFPPVRLNYRGGGEWLEGLGVGVALPVLHAYMQSGELWTIALALLPGFAALSLASAIASGLADETTDRIGGKRTYVTDHGNAAGRRRVEDLVLWGAVLWAIAFRVTGIVSPLFAWLSVAVVAINWHRLRRCSADAITQAFVAQRRYKAVLHHAIWRGGLVVTVGTLWGVVR